MIKKQKQNKNKQNKGFENLHVKNENLHVNYKVDFIITSHLSNVTVVHSLLILYFSYSQRTK